MPDDAANWLDVLALAMAGLWLAGARFVARTRALVATPLTGEAEVALPPAELGRAIAHTLAASPAGSPLGGITFEAADEREVRWNRPVAPRHRGRLWLRGDTRRSRASWEIECGSGFVTFATALVALGGAVTLGLYLALRTWVLPSESPAVRGQVFQMLQAIHMLWPPFLLAGIARGLRRHLGTEIARTVQNAAFVTAP